jgi:hypothetical protein
VYDLQLYELLYCERSVKLVGRGMMSFRGRKDYVEVRVRVNKPHVTVRRHHGWQVLKGELEASISQLHCLVFDCHCQGS